MPDKDDLAAGAAGLGGASMSGAAYQGAGYAAKHTNYKVQNPKLFRDPKTRRGYTKPEYKKAVEAAKKQHGAGTKEFWRNFPDVPSGRGNRILARTHGGKTGLALTAVAGTAGGVAAGKAAKDKVKKSDPHAADPFGISKASKEQKEGYGQAAAGAGILGTVANFKAVEHKVVDHKKKKYDRKIADVQAKIGTKGTPVAGRKQINGQYTPASASQKSTKKGKLKALHGELNELRAKKNAVKRPYLHGNSKATWAGVAVGAPMMLSGAYKTADDPKSPVKKAHDKDDVTAALAGGAAGAGGYQVASLAARKVDRKYEKKIAQDPKLRAKAREYRNSSGLPKNAKPGDPGWTKYFRNYPKDLPGGKWKRAVSYATTGKTGAVATAAVGAAGAAGAVKAKREIKKGYTSPFGVEHP